MVSYANIPEFIRNTTSVLNKEIEKGEKVILIIDSIDELKVLMGLPQDDFSLERYFPNLVKREKKEISIVFIKEKLEQTQFDFICDIIVELYLEIFHGRILRKLVIKKLRGEKIDFSVHLFLSVMVDSNVLCSCYAI